MTEVVDFSSKWRDELLVWQCNCASVSLRPLSNRSAVCDACDTESTGVFGYWRIRKMEMTSPEFRCVPWNRET